MFNYVITLNYIFDEDLLSLYRMHCMLHVYLDHMHDTSGSHSFYVLNIWLSANNMAVVWKYIKSK